VTCFAVGDRVFGVNAGRFGTHAAFVCVPEQAPLAAMPDNLSFEEAAAVCDGAIIALSRLRSAEPLAGRDVLVYGPPARSALPPSNSPPTWART
jgi:NADPH:quinone reductase-like Zn-dependent oxidoreductase